jgi:hypothetical protein
VHGVKYSSYGIEDNDFRGISPKVFRVSIRESDDYIGYITSFYNVPGLFGSTPYQANNFIGIDCAEVLMSAFSLWKGMTSNKDHNVAMIVKIMKKRAVSTLTGGTPETTIRWNSQIRPGDFIAVRYEGTKHYQHIGALYQDANGNGILDGDDMVLHAGPFPLRTAQLSEGSFDGNVIIVRPK